MLSSGLCLKRDFPGKGVFFYKNMSDTKSIVKLLPLGRISRSARKCQVFGFITMAWISLGFLEVAASHASVDTSSRQEMDTPVDLCDWQRDFHFFTAIEPASKTDRVPCETLSLVIFPPAESSKSLERSALENELRAMVAGYPIEAMVPTIADYDRDIAGLIIGIAKKESNWGKRVPRTDTGEDCFNYWGYKGAGVRGVAMGHGCFGERSEAVRAIGDRLQELVALRQTSEPKNMTIWKCGSSCATHSPESVRKWIADVDLYYRAIAEK